MNRVVTDEDRYDRQKRVENWDQECISNAKCLVIGAGALGNEVVKNLAQLGIKRIYLVDFDDVVMANLNRRWMKKFMIRRMLSYPVLTILLQGCT